MLWVAILDKVSLHCIYPALLILNGGMALVLWLAPISPVSLLVCFILVYFCFGGHLAIFPALAAKIFGRKYGPQVFGLMFLGVAVGGFVEHLLMQLKEIAGYRAVLFIEVLFSLIALMVVSTASLEQDWSVLIK